MANAPMLNAALAFARHDHAVLPLTWPARINGRLLCSCRRAADCIAPAKHPLGRLAPNGLLSASTDEATIRKWFTDEPAANLGVRTDGLIVIDIDPRHGGDASLAVLERDHEFPPTWRVLTGGGGEHVIFKCPAGAAVNSSSASSNPLLGPGVDIRSRHGYIVAPPSRHLSGRSYCWNVDYHPADIPIDEAPSWLRANCRERASGVPARIQSVGIGAGASSTSAGGAMTIGGDIGGSGHA